MKNSNIFLYCFIFFLVSIITFSAKAQTNKEQLAKLYTEEAEAINTLLMYPEDTRELILKTTQYPEVLIRFEAIQVQRNTAIQEMMIGDSQAIQKQIWDLIQYPNLIARLVEAPSHTLDEVLEDYPEVIHKQAELAIRENRELLNIIYDINIEAESAFEILLEYYPEGIQKQIHELMALPEVLSILTENIRFTILAGDVFKADPYWVRQKVDSMALELAREQARELEKRAMNY